MSYQLKIDEVLEALHDCDHPKAVEYQGQLEKLVSLMAIDLAAQLGITCGDASFEGLAFAGTCVPFFPAVEGQELPEEIAEYDDRQEWFEAGGVIA